jgi:hypothetical protein
MAVTWVTGTTIDSARENDFYEYFFSAAGSGTITYKKTSGTIPTGLNFSSNGRLSGIPDAVGTLQQYRFVVRATDNLGDFRDKTFNVTVSGQKYIDLLPDQINQVVYPLPSFLEVSFAYHQLPYSLPNITRTPSFRVTAGSLPSGLSLDSATGIISGVTAKTSVLESGTFDPTLYYFDASLFDSVQFNVTDESISKISRFSVTAYDGLSQDTKQYSMIVVAADDMRADIDLIEGSSTIAEVLVSDSASITVDADFSRVDYPVITTTPGSIGTIRQANKFLSKIEFVDPEFVGNALNDGDAFVEITSGSLPNNLTLSPDGWINGYVLPENLVNTIYNFTVVCRKPITTGSTTYLNSAAVNYSLTVKGEIESEIDWVNTSTTGNFTNLGDIFTGEISTLYINAASRSNQALQYELVNGGFGGLPAGLVLLKDGTISGRPSFDIPDNTTFQFRVSVNDNGVSVNTEQEFTLRIKQRSETPYDNLYIQYQGDENARNVLSWLINDGEIIPGEYVYRSLDPWFGKNKDKRILFMTGLDPTSIDYWQTILTRQNNHYDKTITFGDVKAARALDDNFNTIYEVIYVEIVDNYIESVTDSSSAVVESDNSEITVYPNSFKHSSDKISQLVTQATQSVLPRWMSSEQEDGTVLGFTRALVLAYLQPGRKEEVLFNLKTAKEQLKLATFTFNGYDLDNSLSLRYRTNANTFPTNSYTLGTGNISCNTSSNIVLGVNTEISGLGTITSTLINTSLDSAVLKYSPGLRGDPFSTGGNTYVPAFNTYRVGDIVTFTNGNIVGIIESIRSANIMTLDRTPVTFADEQFLIIKTPRFTQEVYVGDDILSGNAVIGTVANIVSNTTLILEEQANATIASNNFSHTTRDSYSTPLAGDKYITFSNIGVLG